MTAPDGYGVWAREYRAAGWAGVLPLPSGQKFPPPTGYTGGPGVDPADAQLLAWAVQFSGGNLALRLPDDVIALDVDHDPAAGKFGGDQLAEAEARLGALPPTWTNTRVWEADWRAGVHGHRFYRVPEGERWRAGLAAHVDVVQRGHRYAVAWPSVHGKSGAVYRWATPDGNPAVRLPRPEEFPDLPDAWVAELVREPVSGVADIAYGKAGMNTTFPRDVAVALAENARAEWLGVAQGGGLHQATLRYLGVLARFLLADGVPVDELEGEVLERLDEHPDAPVSAWESLPGILECVLPAAVLEPWRYEETWLAGFKPSASAVPATATAADLAELVTVCVRKGRPETRAALVSRLVSLGLVPLPLRPAAFERECVAALAEALAGGCSAEFALTVLRRAYTDHISGTDQKYETTILTALGSVLARYNPSRQGDAA
jgi:hypothetical protein